MLSALLILSATPKLDFEAAWKVATKSNSQAVLVMQRGRLVYERYGVGGRQNLPHALASGSKSFTGLLAVAAVQDGLLSSLDERVADTLPDWKSDARKSKVTIRQLLSLESGMAGGNAALDANWSGYDEAAKQPLNSEPGTRFQYGPYPFLTFGAVLTKKLKGETVEAYLKRRILDPLGVKVLWKKTEAGEIALPGGAAMTARDWVTLGQFLLLEGQWKGKQILPAELLKECYRPAKANPGYGMSFWLTPDTSALYRRGQTKKDFAMAAGKGGQRLYLFPKQDLIVVRFGPVFRDDYRDVPFLEALLGESF